MREATAAASARAAHHRLSASTAGARVASDNVLTRSGRVSDSMSVCHPLVEQGSGGRGSLIPDDREGHTASVLGQSIWVFGGTWTDDDDRTIYMNDLHVLDVNHFAWSRPSWVGTPPIEREGHSASVVGSLIFFFAGTWVDVDDEETSVYLNDLHVRYV